MFFFFFLHVNNKGDDIYEVLVSVQYVLAFIPIIIIFQQKWHTHITKA